MASNSVRWSGMKSSLAITLFHFNLKLIALAARTSVRNTHRDSTSASSNRCVSSRALRSIVYPCFPIPDKAHFAP